MEIDYQQIVTIVAEIIKISLPIAFIFGITQKLFSLLMGLAFGKEKINL